MLLVWEERVKERFSLQLIEAGPLRDHSSPPVYDKIYESADFLFIPRIDLEIT